MKNILLAFILMLSSLTHADTIYNIPLQIVFIDNLETLPHQKMINGMPKFVGMYKKVGNICKVYVLRPETWDDAGALHVLGHEVFHCVKGPHTREYVEEKYKLDVK